MITLEHDSLVFRFPELHCDAQCVVSLMRTLRIPDDGRDHPLPPGFGRFSLRHIDDYAACLPDYMTERGGVIMPMYQAEAMWLNFRPGRGFPSVRDQGRRGKDQCRDRRRMDEHAFE